MDGNSGLYARIDALFGAFASGRQSFAEIAEALHTASLGVPEAEIAAMIAAAADRHRLPRALAAAFDGALMHTRDDPDARNETAEGRAGDGTSGETRRTARDSVDDALVNALVQPFKALRARRVQQNRPEDAGLDDALASFKRARSKRQLQTADLHAASADAIPDVPARDSRPPIIGRILRNRFLIEKELGHGGMGTVYRAVDVRKVEVDAAAPYVAIKLLNDEATRVMASLTQLEAEARLTRALAHPNIIAIYDFDRDGDYPFICMELLEGRTVADALAAEPGFAGGEAARQAVRGLLSGMAHAHGQGIAHADLKPANLWLTAGAGMLKILDFGSSLSTTQDDATGGRDALTPAYASPERLEGAPPSPRDDVYALGCLIHLMVNGRHPFNRQTATAARQAGLAPPPLPGLPAETAAAVQAALSFEGDRRPADAARLLAAFDR
ncbi:Protein kinase domain-containing protein [Pseudoxanthobacter soli DSM 19599]|uniref:Protein kinase domain-containing protein n=1 Tax=Pseudoxanthobacter soli DSM 19599 TaxID=1123029 RepID=A0A1M7ZQH2_9HYPH|nr:serine/threonine-protein kinase [Pseudoxanthobacter soli]SHO67160.1 Protein kinase domain-containing protein [Pseudoxanthobacter soli DSM 19599]